jgi:hypothetical protein
MHESAVQALLSLQRISAKKQFSNVEQPGSVKSKVNRQPSAVLQVSVVQMLLSLQTIGV